MERLFFMGANNLFHSIDERFWAKVNKTNSCWLWTGLLSERGYGIFKATKKVRAHRFAYELLIGPIPDGLSLDHLCRVRHCVRPSHLEPVTAAENNRRGDGLTAHNMRKTRCLRGHPFHESTSYLRASRENSRHCRTCQAMRQKARRQRIKEEQHA